MNSLPHIPHFWGLWHSSWWTFSSLIVLLTTLHSLHLMVCFRASAFFFNVYVFVFSFPLVVGSSSFSAFFGLSSATLSRSTSAAGVWFSVLSAWSFWSLSLFWLFCINSAIALSTFTWSSLSGFWSYVHCHVRASYGHQHSIVVIVIDCVISQLHLSLAGFRLHPFLPRC